MKKFQGAIVAIVTPFIDGALDEQGLIDLIEFQIKNGTHGIVPCGTTGESATLSFDEHKRVIELTVQTVKGRVPVIAGTGANSTSEAIELTQSAKECGADAVLSVSPYYNRPSQEGIYLHFKKIAETVDIPTFLYNVPSRTASDINPSTVARLAEVDNIIGIKEACGNLHQISDVIRLCPKEFIVLSGDDFTSMATVFVGGQGLISVTSNVDPKGMSELMEASLRGDIARANEIHYRLFPLMKAMFAAPNPVPAKKGVELLGIIKDGMARLPLAEIDSASLEELKKAMTDLGLI